MNAFKLKVIALTAMIIDHIGGAFPHHTPFELRVIGRLTFPIFVYLLAEGFRHTRSPGKFLLRLFAFALISEPFYDWALTRARNTCIDYSPWQVDFLNYTNIFYTLFLGGCAIVVFKWLNRVLRLCFLDDDSESPLFDRLSLRPGHLLIAFVAALPTAGYMWLAEQLGTDYGGYGALFIFLMYVIKSPKWLMLTVFAVMNVWQHIGLFETFALVYRYEWFTIPFGWYLMIPVTLLTVPLVAFYNKKRGPGLKWLFYAAYPVHLAALAGVVYFL